MTEKEKEKEKARKDVAARVHRSPLDRPRDARPMTEKEKEKARKDVAARVQKNAFG
jgi:hypothetical protein